MNFQDVEHSLGKRKKNATKIAPFIALAILFTLIPIYYPCKILTSSFESIPDDSTRNGNITTQQINVTKSDRQEARIIDHEKCDLFVGEWVENEQGPYYTNMTCFAIQEHQNCMKYGRPDTDFFKWKWKPDACELPIFDAHQFLEIVRGKSLAFVGDSVARNHMQSLICLLSKVNSHQHYLFVI